MDSQAQITASAKSLKKNDYINLFFLMVFGFIVTPMIVTSDYWYTSILIPWLCLSLATIGQQIVMGYTGQLSLGAAGFMAAGALSLIHI